MSTSVTTLWAIDRAVVERLCEELTRQHTKVTGYAPPNTQVVAELLRVAANASLLQEEGRATTFTLIFDSGVRPSDDGFLALQKGLPYTPETLRRLAPVLGGPFDFLVVDGAEDETLTVTGVLHVQQAIDVSTRHVRAGVFVDARGPGQLSVGHNGEELLRVSPQGISWPPRPVAADLTLLRALDEALRLSRGDSLCSQESVVLLRLGRGLLSHGHGGALFVCVGSDDADSLTAKYRLEPAWKGLQLGVLASHVDEGAESRALERAEWEVRAYAQNRLPEAVATVARLSAVDGAVLLGADLSVYGFGTFVAMGRSESEQKVVEYRIGRTGDMEQVGELKAGTTGGARHQSAVKFVCDRPGERVAFVASQDGSLTLLFACEDRTGVMIRPIGPAALSR